jgi:hypothetical protein
MDKGNFLGKHVSTPLFTISQTYLTRPVSIYGGSNGFSTPWLSLGFEIHIVASILVMSMNTLLSAKKRPGHIL